MKKPRIRKPNWAIINQVRKEKREAAERRQYREVEPGVFIK